MRCTKYKPLTGTVQARCGCVGTVLTAPDSKNWGGPHPFVTVKVTVPCLPRQLRGNAARQRPDHPGTPVAAGVRERFEPSFLAAAPRSRPAAVVAATGGGRDGQP